MHVTSRGWDIAGATALVAWNAIAAIGIAILLIREWPRIGEPLIEFRILSQLAALAWLALQIYYLCVRYRPVRKLAGAWPRAVAILGANAAVAIALLPLNASPFLQVVSALVATAGMAGSIYALFYLGRSFSVFPQARGLIVTGPYRIVRHPLYLFELVTTVGISMLYIQPWGICLAVGSFALQFPRIRYEEEVMGKTFPDYARLSARWRLLPLIY